jgi:hypothetical protein
MFDSNALQRMQAWEAAVLVTVAIVLSGLCLLALWRRPGPLFQPIGWTVVLLIPFLGPVLFLLFCPAAPGLPRADRNLLVAVAVLQKLGLDLDALRKAIEDLVGPGPGANPVMNTPMTPRVKKVLSLAEREAKSLNHTYVGTEHLLLALLREGNGVAARVLSQMGTDVERTRREKNWTRISSNLRGEILNHRNEKTVRVRSLGLLLSPSDLSWCEPHGGQH